MCIYQAPSDIFKPDGILNNGEDSMNTFWVVDIFSFIFNIHSYYNTSVQRIIEYMKCWVIVDSWYRLLIFEICHDSLDLVNFQEYYIWWTIFTFCSNC